jgi:uncharacterized membrane protein YjfL (UPF0719 family)
MLSTTVLLATLLYAGIGLAIFVIGFWIWDRLTPINLWRQICEEKNVALAIFAGSIALSLAIIIAAAIHG